MYKNKLQTIILDKPNIVDFAKERNNLLDKSKANWVFFLDKDEVASKSLIASLHEAINSEYYNGFSVKRDNYFNGIYCGSDKIVRVVRKGKGIWKRAVHERLTINGPVLQLNGVLTHNTAENVYKMIDKINSYTTLHAKENIKEGKHSGTFKIVFFPIFKFIESLFKGRGLVFSMLQSLHSFLSWSKQWELQRD